MLLVLALFFVCLEACTTKRGQLTQGVFPLSGLTEGNQPISLHMKLVIDWISQQQLPSAFLYDYI